MRAARVSPAGTIATTVSLTVGLLRVQRGLAGDHVGLGLGQIGLRDLQRGLHRGVLRLGGLELGQCVGRVGLLGREVGLGGGELLLGLGQGRPRPRDRLAGVLDVGLGLLDLVVDVLLPVLQVVALGRPAPRVRRRPGSPRGGGSPGQGEPRAPGK